jgi:hypothetical protein
MSAQLSRSLQRLALLWAGAFCNAGLQDRADSNRHVGSGLNCFDYPVLRPSNRRVGNISITDPFNLHFHDDQHIRMGTRICFLMGIWL